MTEIAGRGTDKLSERSGISYHANGLRFGEVDYKAWETAGAEMSRVIGVFHNHIKWWLGDWIIFGENRFPQKYSQALDETMYSIGTLRNCVYVCRNIPIDNRNPGLSFEHHYEVAKLPIGDQAEWLAQADANNWTCRQLRQAIKGETPSKKALPDRLDWKKDEDAAVPTLFDDWYLAAGGKEFLRMFSDETIEPRDVALFVWEEARKNV